MFTIEGPLCNDLLAAKGYCNVCNPFNLEAPYEYYFVQEGLFREHPGMFERRRVPAKGKVDLAARGTSGV
jgi:hypothetical protein